MKTLLLLLASCAPCGACGAPHHHASSDPRLPLVKVADAPLPGGATRFDYQDLDPQRGILVVAHMNDGTVLILDLDGKVLAEIANVPTARGVVIAPEIGRIFVTSSPNQLVEIDETTLAEVGRVTTGSGPDGVGWDPAHQVVGVSDQRDGALSLIPDAGHGTRTQVALGQETGNVVYDAVRGWFWITVVPGSGADQLVAVDPVTATIAITIEVPGCDGAHGLRLHPDGQSALIACEDNDKLARVGLEGAHDVAIGDTGSGPDVLAIDAGLGWLYVAAESGDLTVFDLNAAGVSKIDDESPGAGSHTVAVDPATHRVYFPLANGPGGKPALRIMRPAP
jgi:DNA-binding beta-propeller fold protein YncE